MLTATTTTAGPVFTPSGFCVGCGAHQRDDEHKPACLWAGGPLRGLSMDVLRRAGGDCTLGGVSSRYDRLTVVAVIDDTGRQRKIEAVPYDWRVSAPTDDAPAVALVKRNIGGLLWTVAPLDYMTRWYMYGGNHADCSDSRWRALVDFYGAVAIHDRHEG